MTFTYEFEMAANTSTAILTYFHANRQYVLLGRRSDDSDAYPGAWSFPGGYLNAGTERIINCVRRETKEECDIDIDESRWKIFYIDDRPGADPRYKQVVNSCFYVTLTIDERNIGKAGDDLQEIKWVTVDEAKEMNLAFDHNTILNIFDKLAHYNKDRLY